MNTIQTPSKQTLQLAIKALQKDKQFKTGRLNHLKGQRDRYTNTTALQDLNNRITTLETNLHEHTRALEELKEVLK